MVHGQALDVKGPVCVDHFLSGNVGWGVYTGDWFLWKALMIAWFCARNGVHNLDSPRSVLQGSRMRGTL